MILPFSLVTVFNWIMFVLIMVSICGHTQAPVADKKEGSRTKVIQTHFTIAATLAVIFGLGWSLGLAATSLPVKELTLTFQILFSIFVGAQGVLLFLLHGVRNQDIRKTWIHIVSHKSCLAHVMRISTKTSSVALGSLNANRNTAAASTLPRNSDKYPSAVENTYSKQPYQASVGNSVAMNAVLASKDEWDQSEGGLRSNEEHTFS